MSARSQLVVIVGTGTEVGKTWVAARLLTLARSGGRSVAARKPVQSFDPSAPGLTDAELLGQASGEHSHSVCPAHRWYPVPMAPPMAADTLGRPPVRVADLIEETAWPAHAELRVLETAGGLMSPIAHDADNLDLIRRLDPDHVLLVADAGLGTLNAVRLCAWALSGSHLVVCLNRYDAGDELHALNLRWLREKYGLAAEHEVSECWHRLRLT